MTATSNVLEFTTEVDWHENHKILKMESFPNVTLPRAMYEVQFGHVHRPTHKNTSYEFAQWEVCAQRWADVSMYNSGLTIINDSKHGYSYFDDTKAFALSLLRSPKKPDDECDMGKHVFR